MPMMDEGEGFAVQSKLGIKVAQELNMAMEGSRRIHWVFLKRDLIVKAVYE
ncbi:hypothetical protein M493_02595 [Geobacillus genomosp. 3]|uniref:Uncharacterized protein n=1 Tax=Geobacillus genomosp. 3 TaxID=1921421 RepID=S5Z1M3_GEOG3|nr:hypothetical protein M493_02595 [Geobacillus genomosp. 3]